MARTTSAAVALIIEVDANIALDAFIETASFMVTQHCAGTGYSDVELELIERWLSAHFYAVRDPRATQEQAKGVGATYQSKVDLGFNVTHYGQMAMRLDYKGGLAAADASAKSGKARKIGMTYLGEDYAE